MCVFVCVQMEPITCVYPSSGANANYVYLAKGNQESVETLLHSFIYGCNRGWWQASSLLEVGSVSEASSSTLRCS